MRYLTPTLCLGIALAALLSASCAGIKAVLVSVPVEGLTRSCQEFVDPDTGEPVYVKGDFRKGLLTTKETANCLNNKEFSE